MSELIIIDKKNIANLPFEALEYAEPYWAMFVWEYIKKEKDSNVKLKQNIPLQQRKLR